jgi:hypothetical protein
MRKLLLVLIGVGSFALIGGSAAAAPITKPAISADTSVIDAHWGWGYRGYGRGYYGRSYGHGYYGRSYGHGYYGRSYYGRGYYGRRW